MYVVEPGWGWYQVLPHCWYVRPFTMTVVQLGGSDLTMEPTTAAVTAAVATTATGWGSW